MWCFLFIFTSFYASSSLAAPLPEDLGEKICGAVNHSTASSLFYDENQSPILKSETNRNCIQGFLKAFYKSRPIATRYTSKEFFENPDKGHATIVIYPQNNMGVKSLDGHCALVTEYVEQRFLRNPVVKKRHISLETNEGGGLSPSSGGMSSGGGTHSVKVRGDGYLINSLVWHYEDFYEETKLITRHDIGGYYPDTTFLVDLKKMKEELKIIDQHSMDGKYPYDLRASNCCTYVFDRLKGMGVDIEWPQWQWTAPFPTIIHRAENLKTAAQNSPSEKRKLNATPRFVKNTDNKVVHMDVNIFNRLFKEYCETCEK